MLHSFARNSSLISLFFSHATLNIERNNYTHTYIHTLFVMQARKNWQHIADVETYEMKEWDISLWTVSHRNRALYTVEE